MAVRFLPPPGDPAAGAGPDRGDLAEVIELRGMLRQRAWADPSRATEQGVSDLDDPDLGGSDEREPESEPEPAPAAAQAEGARGGRTAVISALGDHLTRASDLARAAQPGRGSAGAPEHRVAPAAAAAEPDSGHAAEQTDTALQEAHEDGVRLLARRARSSGELREELLRLDHAASEVDVVIAEFEERLYLDDAGLARAVTEKLRDSKRASRSQIRVKLRERRLPDAVIEAALGELDDDEEFSLLREAAIARAAKLGGLERSVAERRLLGFLARRGWSGEPASRAVREALDGTGRGGSRTGRGSGVRFQ